MSTIYFKVINKVSSGKGLCVHIYFINTIKVFPGDMDYKPIVDTDSKQCSSHLQDMSDELHLTSSWALNNLKYLP